MYIKKLTLCLPVLALLSFASEDIDKKQLFKEKYLDDQKINRYKDNTNCTVDYEISNIKEMKKISEDLNETSKNIIKGQIKNPALENEAKKISDHTRSSSFQKKVINNENHLLYDEKLNWQQHLGKYRSKTERLLKQQKEQPAAAAVSTNKFLAQDERIFIVISSSMPEDILKTYFSALEKVNTDITFVLRGTIGERGKIMPTLKWIEKALSKSDGTRYEHNIIIEPRIVSKYNIKKVPAVLYVQNYNPSYTENNADEKHWVHYGTVDPGYAFEKINRYTGSSGLKRISQSY